MLGGDTLQELRSSLVMAEQERDGGVSPHISPFTTLPDVGNLLSSAGFSLTTVDQEQFTVNYADAFILMYDLRSMGENNATLLRRKFVSKETFISAAAIYKAVYGNSDGTIPATFNVIYFIGWAPHQSQPKPKSRGSQQASFADIDRLVGTREKK
jgi:NADH dehydrogenase [ubiquinone] 1 alpha subcomplex assembly factor 5